MYKLTVVGGPGRGTSFAINEGENWVGRQTGNSVVLASARVSKRHCVLVVSNGELLLKDEGSANGTFVNGVLTKSKKVSAGDKISVGEYILQLDDTSRRPQALAPAIEGFGTVVRLPRPVSSPALSAALDANRPALAPQAASMGPPQDLKGKLLWHFEKQIMPFFYTLNLKHEWRFIALGVFGVFILASIVVSVQPLLGFSRAAVVKEMGKRAEYMAREIAERNAPLLAANARTKTEVGSVQHADGVRMALLLDMESQILAPSQKLNQYLTSGKEAVFAMKARDKFRAGRETGMLAEIDNSTLIAVQPVKIFEPSLGKNVVRGLAVVTMDTSLSTLDAGEIGVVYSEALILAALLGALILMVLYRLTLKPYEVLGDDLDKVLKGDLPQVSRQYKLGEMEGLWDLINSALQRVSRGDTPEGGAVIGSSVEDFAAPLRVVGDLARFGMMVCDGQQQVVYMNTVFEEISGIRQGVAIGQAITAVARDQALGAFMADLLSRAAMGEIGPENYEFSGISYTVQAAAFGMTAGAPKGFVIAFKKLDD